ncbi:MAG: hypothetical protein OXE82_07545, partial [Rhodobacter sp.]|nr:hypothetical protein [Rhodobacter sp.]
MAIVPSVDNLYAGDLISNGTFSPDRKMPEPGVGGKNAPVAGVRAAGLSAIRAPLFGIRRISRPYSRHNP